MTTSNTDEQEKAGFVEVSKMSFIFCRYSMATLVWLAFVLKIKWILIVVFGLAITSAILTVKWAPLILLYANTLGKLIKSETESLNIGAMRFAHGSCSTLSAVCLLLLYFGDVSVGWIVVGVFAVLKTISAIGLCPAARLYTCVTSMEGTCCSFLRKKQ